MPRPIATAIGTDGLFTLVGRRGKPRGRGVGRRDPHADQEAGRREREQRNGVDQQHLVGALDRPEADAQGQDAGLLAGAGACGIIVSADALPAFAHTDAVLDFTAPEATVAYSELSAQARIVHVIGTTGLTAQHEERLKAAAAPQEERTAEVAPAPGELVIYKERASAFFGTPLVAHLRRMKIDSLIICGESTSGCVRASTSASRRLGGCSPVFWPCKEIRNGLCQQLIVMQRCCPPEIGEPSTHEAQFW